ncbi:TadE/TadG family type IV pilus assembly protein [Albibacillus kandeliae]|uniref:TadE/TadG family type IV pilus assembly protein n=1 Tax=Albibacillus kandeliae TaxID=2174228 RepID=UPI000D69B75C|nr:TadE/TadG family type IV pilus assembly protein [Albibacillus kandeliae]
MQRFTTSEEGGILVFWVLSLTAFLGLVALSFDIGRVGIARSELQSFADSVALAAAGELDGNDDSITRARAAAANLVSDLKTYGSRDAALAGDSDYTLTFFSALPASDTTAPSATTTNGRAAAYVRATVTPSTVDQTFAAAFFTLSGQTPIDTTATASAIAGFTQYACDVTPLMFCIPDSDWDADLNIGSMVNLRSGGNGSAWGPGDFGFLDPAKLKVDGSGPCAGKTGVNLDACLLGAVGSITQCFVQRGVDIEPGQKVGIADAIFNVRFDIYKAIMNGEKNDPDYAPAPNVIKGIVPKGGGACIGNNEVTSPNTKGMPRDDCLAAGTCGRFGNGNWSAGRTEYVNYNYAGTDPHLSASTRYDYYLAEIAAAGGGGSSTAILSGLAETGRPQCSSNQSPDPERRVIIAAGIDCGANSIGGAAKNVPVKQFVKMFLTEPVGDDGTSPPTVDIWAEIIGRADNGGAGAGGTGGVFHDVVQLYR